MAAKILALVDALGNLVGFHLLPGHRHDICGVEPLLGDREFGALLADIVKYLKNRNGVVLPDRAP